MVGLPIAVGLYAMRHAASARFGRLLVLAGFGWFLTTLAESPTPWVYSTGRVAGWFVEVSLIYLILAFPTGRLPARVDRLLVAAGAGARRLPVHADRLPRRALPAPEPVDATAAAPARRTCSCWSRTSPRVIEALVLPLRDLLTIALFVAVTARVAWRFQHATAVAQAGAGPGARRSRSSGSSSSSPRSPCAGSRPSRRRRAPGRGCWRSRSRSWPWPSSSASGAGACSSQRRCSGSPSRLQGRHRPDQIEAALAEEFQDRSLTIVRRVDHDPGHWVDTAGDPRSRRRWPRTGSL